MKKRWGLSAIATICAAAGVTAAMAFDAINEHVRRGWPLGALVTEHLIHAVLLTSASCFILWLGFDLALAAPLRAIASALKSLGEGSLEPVSLKTRVREIDAIVGTVNLVVERLKLNFPRHTVEAVQAEVIALRAIAESMPPPAKAQALQVMEIADQLQLELATLVHGEAVLQRARAAEGKAAPLRA